ncbi:MAG: malonyl-ACP O-methyltransferase BioC [Chromatiales bacterium]|nr:malonyl-ACP O-methyltransferase BioC [Chromatiales bacterium]
MTEPRESDTEMAYLIDKQRVRAAFDRAAPAYESVAVLQREVATRLEERLELIRLEPQTVLDVGAGTGELSARLSKRYPAAQLVLIDLSRAMLEQARMRGSFFERLRRKRLFVCGDAERLPLAPACADLIVSNLMLQWCNDLEAVLQGLRRALRPGGLLIFTTLGPDTLRELRASWRAVDLHVHVNAFIDMHDVGDALLRAGFSDPVMDREDIVLTYDSVATLMRELKTLGAHNSTGGRPRGLTGPARLKSMTNAYERFRQNGRLPATYEVIHGHCWAPTTSANSSGGREVKIPLSQLKEGRGKP